MLVKVCFFKLKAFSKYIFFTLGLSFFFFQYFNINKSSYFYLNFQKQIYHSNLVP